ncbi:DUF4828 domain-containing protein [Agrilactobacillus fermenti]|uniref:DUF4828 domain-containing protein n=1 Tax=Agrilactobacillus fermenti TaxID=2586909 RepID=UPI001E410FDC|nr:DUF4828 domain-containing protein [Agrilactobacillus fermenti]MCD2255159.1 DUF4828 domain-containing protein [Agrilactobacillus fermenti]
MAGIFKEGAQWFNDWHQKRKIRRQKHQIGNVEPDFSTIFRGKWAFVDSQTQRKHIMFINSDLQIIIDGKLLEGHIIGLNSDLLTFLDHYGFQLKIFAEHQHPIKIYDESSGETYEIADMNQHQDN